MPKLTEALCNIRSCCRKNLNQRQFFPIFQQWLPAELKDKVRGRRERSSDACSEQMQAVLSCWNKHDFESAPCKHEIEKFQKCFTQMQAKTTERKSQQAQGLIGTETKNLTRHQVNSLLRNNPQQRPQQKFGLYNESRPRFD